jgi:hypothetical protein
MSMKGRGREIRTCGLYFIRRSSQPIELLFGDTSTMDLIFRDALFFFFSLSLYIIYDKNNLK